MEISREWWLVTGERTILDATQCLTSIVDLFQQTRPFQIPEDCHLLHQQLGAQVHLLMVFPGVEMVVLVSQQGIISKIDEDLLLWNDKLNIKMKDGSRWVPSPLERNFALLWIVIYGGRGGEGGLVLSSLYTFSADHHLENILCLAWRLLQI